MDLAKIRKKSLQTAESSCLSASFFPPERSDNAIQPVSAAPLSPDIDSFQKESYTRTVSAIADAPLFESAILQSFAAPRTPLEAILAGRTAAGCDDDSVIENDVATEVCNESGLEFLCFRVSDEIYGINIMDIKEIIKKRVVTEVPRTPSFMSGILSLRGTIIPVIDLRIRLGLACSEQTGKERIIVVKNKNSYNGLLVDEVTQVVRVQRDSFEEAPPVLEGIDRDFVTGIGRSGEQLIIIVNVENITDINLYS